MRLIKYTIILFSLLAIASSGVAQSGEYFDRIAVVSDGRIARFTEMPITVYASSPEPYDVSCLDDLNYALKEWEEQSVGVVSFQLTKEPEGADVVISWATKLKSHYREHPLGIAELHRTEKGKFYVELLICLRDPTTVKPLSSEQLRAVLLHEMGHAIGLWGHSKDKNDIMYYAACVQHPTQNDIMTLKSVYAKENGYAIHEKSIEVIQEDIRENPSESSLYYLLGTIYLDQGNAEASIKSLKKCLEINPQYHKARIALASAYRSIGQEQLAISEYLILAQSEPSAMIHNVIATSLYNSGDTDVAISHLRKALEIDRTYEPAKRNLYGLYLNKGSKFIEAKKYADAIKFLSEGIKAFPDKPEMLNLLGVAYSEMGLYEEALKQYKVALQYSPGFREARDNIASCYNSLGIKYAEINQWEKSIEAYDQAIKFAPEMSDLQHNMSALYWNRAVYYSSIGNLESAINAYLEYLKREPNSMDAYNNLGAAYSRLARYDDSIKALERALQIDPNSQDVKSNLAIAHQKWGYDLMQSQAYDGAIEEFKKALVYDQSDANLYLLLAVTHDRVGKLDDAIGYTENALRLDPKNMNAKKIITNLKIYLGNTSLESKNYDQALHYYTTIPEEMKTYQVANNIAYIYIKQEKFLQALEQINQVLEAEPKDEIANNNLASMESKLEERLRENHDSQDIKDQLATVRLKIATSHIYQGDIDRAKRILRSALVLEPKDEKFYQILRTFYQKLADAYLKRGDTGKAEEINRLIRDLK